MLKKKCLKVWPRYKALLDMQYLLGNIFKKF